MIIQSRGQGTGRQAGSGQAEVGNPEVEQRYRAAGMQSGQAGGYMDRQGTKTRRTRKRDTGKSRS